MSKETTAVKTAPKTKTIEKLDTKKLSLSEKLCLFRKEIHGVLKTGFHQQYKSKTLKTEDLWKAFHPILVKYNITWRTSVVPGSIQLSTTQGKTKNGNLVTRYLISALQELIVSDDNGEQQVTTFPFWGQGDGDPGFALGKGQTYSLKYHLPAALGIITGNEIDPDFFETTVETDVEEKPTAPLNQTGYTMIPQPGLSEEENKGTLIKQNLRVQPDPPASLTGEVNVPKKVIITPQTKVKAETGQQKITDDDAAWDF